jgi:surfeit locus 1 family protein
MLFCAVAIAAAGLFARLGFWQLSRLREKQAHNAVIAQQRHRSPVPFATLPRDTAQARYRAATLAGRFDYEHELVLTNRTRRGSPGVELLTPVRVAGTDTVVLVNRGWVYAPDGTGVDRTRWHDGDSARVTGYVESYAADGEAPLATDPRIVRRVSRREIAVKLPYAMAPYYVVQLGDTGGTGHPARKESPALDDGPHRGYAVQWFCFAAIALGGAAAIVRGERKDRRHA